MFTFAAVWLSAPLLHIFVENLFGQVRRSAPKHSHLHVNEERAVPCQHSSEDVAHTHTHTHTHISNAVLQCSLICCLLRISVLLIIFSLILVFGIVSSYTRYKIRKVQRVFSEKSPTLISQPASLSLGTHNYQSLCMFKIHKYAHLLNK